MSEVSVDNTANDKWRDLRRLTDRASKFAPSYFDPTSNNLATVQECKILVVGAGGLGCELLKNLALSGFRNIDVIDMDTIDLSNLNRQFLFREADVGKSKAEVAAEFIRKRVHGVNVAAHNCRIQDYGSEFYRQFHMVVCGLDSIVARRWLNAMLCDLAVVENGELDQGTVIPLIDGGTEGFKGNARVIYPRMSPCVECTLDLYPPQINFPLCTIAHTPRLPEHCVEYVKVVMWDKLVPFDGATLDADDPAHVDWCLEQASERAEKYGIRGVDRRLTQGVLKRIIPAVASTNAVIAASCALEAFKLATNISKPIDNYLNFTDIEGVYVGTVKLEKNPNCVVCSQESVTIEVDKDSTFGALLDKIMQQFQLKNPSVRAAEVPLYELSEMFGLKEQSEANLGKNVRELIKSGQEILIADEVLTQAITVVVRYDEETNEGTK